MRPSPAESKWASKYSRSPHTQQACVGVRDAKNSIIQPNPANRLHKPAHGAGRGGGHGRWGCSAPPSCPNCSGLHSAAWLGCPGYRIRLLPNKIKAQTYMPYIRAIRQAKQILHNHTDNIANNRPTCTAPHTSHSEHTQNHTQNQQQRATQKTFSYANMVRNGRELNTS